MDTLRTHLLPFLAHSGEQMIPLLFGLVLIPQLILVPQGIAAKMADDVRGLVGRIAGAPPPRATTPPPPTLDSDTAAELAGRAEPMAAAPEPAAEPTTTGPAR